MSKITPYIMFEGNCEEAMNFYKECFSGEITYMGRYKDSPMDIPKEEKNKVMHSELRFFGGSIYASDYMEKAPFTAQEKGAKVHLNINFDSVEELETTFSILRQGGKIIMEPQDTFWGDRFAMLQDKFGVNWMLDVPLKKKN